MHHTTTSSMRGEGEVEIRYEVISTNQRLVDTERKVDCEKRKAYAGNLIPLHKPNTYTSLALVIKRHVLSQAFLL